MSRADPPGPRGVRYVVSVGAREVGARVVVRRRLPDGRLGDLLGELLRFDASALALRDRDGVVHEVRRGDLVAAKQIPPPPDRIEGRPARAAQPSRPGDALWPAPLPDAPR